MKLRILTFPGFTIVYPPAGTTIEGIIAKDKQGKSVTVTRGTNEEGQKADGQEESGLRLG